MFMKELSCPYCEAKQDPHGFGQLDYVNTRNCQKCCREFVFIVSVMYQTFVEADFSETQKEETPAFDALKKIMETETPKELSPAVDEKQHIKKAYISNEVIEKFNNWSANRNITKKTVCKEIAGVFRFSTATVTAMFNNNMMATAPVMEEFYQITGIRAEIEKSEGKVMWCLVNDMAYVKPVVSGETENTIHNTDGMTTFVYQIGYQSPVTETRKINPADISAYLERISKKHKDTVTDRALPIELISVNGVKVKKEDPA
jgi:transcription antitermination factor NusG